MKFKPYPKYKDSGVQWIGEIPEKWKVRKLKFNYEIKPKSNLAASEGEEEGNYPFFTSGENIKFIDKSLADGEYIIAGDGGIPNFKYYKGKFSYSDHCFLLKPKSDVNPKFLFYFLIGSLDSIDILCFQGMGLRNLDKYKFNSYFSCLSNLETQQKIASFLDIQTSKLNQTIEADKKLIELLKEKRTALINHVVTKGLNPKAKMKDSGIDWIGEVPEGWGVRKIKYSCLINKKNLGEETIPSLRINYLDISNVDNTGNIISTEELYFEDAPSRARRVPDAKDTIISTVRTYLKAIAYLDQIPDTLIVSTGFAVLHPDKKIMQKYLFYVVSSENFIQKVIADSTGVAYPAINPSDLGQIQIILPHHSEQFQIIQYLDKATSRIDETIQKIEKKIELLEEYKKSLIHYVVTGKVDVREVII